jgi:hypothetical protein
VPAALRRESRPTFDVGGEAAAGAGVTAPRAIALRLAEHVLLADSVPRGHSLSRRYGVRLPDREGEKMAKTMIATSSALLLLLVASLSAAQVPELLKSVDAGKAKRLAEYNSASLQAELYSAKRFRIVALETSLLLEDDDFTVTPFDDVPPIHLTKDVVHRWEDAVAWSGLMKIDLPEALSALGARPTAMLSAMAWDTDESGNAFESSLNRFEYSPYWTFDDSDRPRLEVPEGQKGVAGPPPQTPAEIARHKALKALNKHAFFSVHASFELLFPRATYMLVPLKYAPKYSVIYEVDPEKRVPITVDRSPDGSVPHRTPEELAKLADYESFIRGLPHERNVPVVEDVL